MGKSSVSKGVVKDIIIVAIGVIVIWLALQVAFGTQNPFYVVASGSMIPELLVYDVLIVQGHEPFEEIQVGDIIVFNRPSDHDRVIVHRVASIIDDNPKTIRTKGDANPASIPGTDFPITEEEYIGKVAYVIPQIGYVTQILKPPTNYIIIAIVVGIMIAKQMVKKKKEKELTFEDPFDSKDSDKPPEIPELEKLKKDLEYSQEESNESENSIKENSNVADVNTDPKNQEKPKKELDKKEK
ncbi:signal peptidase I [Nitrosopumilus sp. K4]|uniref:signal peptidase I n=1 Tax=Nitrosopumilus sp. K4 TaxID=2795383 RepID=UPI001BA6509D|nr:signal peptidase I [Nitrosopumilus sp. K4]QUC64336.1 signal peptidase I [Nitrosopumilus sp. K4]